ncbi:MAG: long-chain fatty acid--CoA ligase [Pseudomonadota bacterium]
MTATAQQRVHGVMINTDFDTWPPRIDGEDTLPKLFRKRVEHYGDRVALRYKHHGIWKSWSWRGYSRQVDRFAAALLACGVERNGAIAILSEDNPEWYFADMAGQAIGAIVTGVYTTDSAEQLAYIVENSRSTVLFVENDEQLDKFLDARGDMPGLGHVVVFDNYGLHDFSDPNVHFLDDFLALGDSYLQQHSGAVDRAIDAGKPEDAALLIYTSGTTGRPKGAEITQAAMFATASATLMQLPSYDSDEMLCFLPLCHVLERMSSMVGQVVAGFTVNFAESVDTVFENVQEVSPHVFVAVPRLWEKMYSRVEYLIKQATPLGQRAYAAAVRAGEKRAQLQLDGKPVSPWLRAQCAVWDIAVFANLRRMLGLNRVHRAATGAAPISPQLLGWFHAIGVPLYEGYGMTESSGIMSANTRGQNRIGSVGKVLPCGAVRIAADGEILYRGANLFRGYWNKPEATAETLVDGWLHTGDVGHVDDDGYLYITGRAKDIIITAGGKNISPAEIENQLKFSPYVADAVVIGDRRQYLTALVMIDQENVEKFAQDNRVPFNDFASLCAAEEVRNLISEVVESVNARFARVEQIKYFRLIDQLLTAEDEELTATMKLKRAVVERNYSGLIEGMYANAR